MAKYSAPDSNYLWVEEVVSSLDSGVGCVIQFFPPGYIPLSRILNSHNSYSERIACAGALHYVRAMRNTYDYGWLFFTYEGENNCFFHPNTGHLLISDCEMIAPAGIPPPGLLTIPRYAAPELLLNKCVPKRWSNRYVKQLCFLSFCSADVLWE